MLSAPRSTFRTGRCCRQRSSDLHTGANKVTDAVEKALVNAVNGLAEVNRKTVEAMYQDAQSIAAINNLADAQSFAQAYKVYVDSWASRPKSVSVA